MPTLDVSEVLTDPDFCQTVGVRRQTQSVDTHGRAQSSESDFNIVAVVTIGAMGAVERGADYTLGRNTITVHTQTKLHGPIPNGYPDIVVWQGNNYVVKRSFDWSQYGVGFTANECELQDTVKAS